MCLSDFTQLPPDRTGNRVHHLIHQLFTLVRHGAQSHPYWCFPIAAIVAFTESFVGLSLIVPGTFLLITLGGVIGASHISLWPAWTGAVLGSITGDWISWWIGLRYHRQIIHIWPFSRFEGQIAKGLQFFHRWGTLAIFIGRFTGPLRATVPLVSGMSELEFWPFMVANAASALIWAFVLLAPGAAFLRHLVP
ncbi:MAG TPA: DedA family protein [Rhizomicrobium sp.]|jgi:membrane protein DedA with SNARE-associated domain|nr:DedA family protein [Rhizomicrobium sp.]